jgi:glycosyltransferase involved in cell wall biosynthesis
MPEPLVSIVMNCYNGARFLREAIDSVFAQTYANWELIFWDNASTDGTSEIASAYAGDPRFRYFRAETTTRLGPARNLALKKTTGDYIAFLDSDDSYLPETLEKQMSLMLSGEYGLVYGGAIIIDENGREIKRGKIRHRSGHILARLLTRYDIAMVSAMIRRSAIEGAALGFNESFAYCPDYNLFMRIAARHSVGVLQEYIVKNRRVSTSLSKSTLHLVSVEIGHTLDELQRQYPEALVSCERVMLGVRAKLNYYDAISHINQGDYAAAQASLRPIIRKRAEYLALYLALFLPIPKTWVLRGLNR